MAADTNELRGDLAFFGHLNLLAPGVIGYSVEEDGTLWIPIIVAEVPDSGDVGRYLDALPRDRRVCAPNVLSLKLAGMLDRRGFVERYLPLRCREMAWIWERQAT